MSARENWRGLSTSRASKMRPAHVPKIGLPAAWNFSIAGTNSDSSMSLRSVVDSPPGMMSPPTASSSSGLRTRTASTSTGGLASPLARSRLAQHQLMGRAEVLGLGHQLLGRERREASDSRGDRAHVPHGLHDVARARLALGADHRRALADAPERLAQVACAADKRDAEGELVDVEMLVRGREDLGLVDEVHAKRLEDLGLDKVADPRLGHHRNRDGLLDLLDLRHRGHPRDAAILADIGGHAPRRPHPRPPPLLPDLSTRRRARSPPAGPRRRRARAVV